MIRSTLFHTMTLKMNKATFERFVDRLVEEIENNPHKEEIVALTAEQIIDDTDECVYDSSTFVSAHA